MNFPFLEKSNTFDSELIMNLSYDLFLVIVTIVTSVVLAKIAKKSIKGINKKSDKLDSTAIPILTSTVSYVIYSISLIIILDIFGVNTASIVALLGTIGLAVGFALKDTLSNIAAGIMLLFLRPFKVSDTIEFSSTTGKVIEINLFTTILETADGIFVCSPNSNIWKTTIKNFSKNPKRRMTISVGVGYQDSPTHALETLLKLVKEEERILSEPAPQAVLTSLGDSSVNLELRCWANTPDYWNAYWDLNKKLKDVIEEAGLSIPFPQRDINVYNHQVKPN